MGSDHGALDQTAIVETLHVKDLCRASESEAFLTILQRLEIHTKKELKEHQQWNQVAGWV